MSDAPLDWYFDFISPFAYLQWRRLRRDHADVAINPKPVLFAAILNHVGQLGPAEIPQKRRHTYRMVLWQAREANIPLAFPPAHPFNPVPALRLCLAAPDRAAAVDAIFAQIWEHGRAADSIEALAEVAHALGINDPAAAIARDEVKRALLANGEAALALAERIRQTVAAQPLVYANASVTPALSLGVAELAPGETLDRAIARADQALYRSKEEGRNRVTAAA